MPTPFLHLTYAQELLSHKHMDEQLSGQLQPATGAFLLGNTAADIQTLTHASRTSTHFYSIRYAQPTWGWENMLVEYPELANPHHLDTQKAAFISGYLVHLFWDEVWTREIFTPFFMDASWWTDRLTYVIYHNALRVIHDRCAHVELRKHENTLKQLAETQPDNWLPFASDSVLNQWRNWLVEQLQHGGKSHTIRVFSERMGIAPAQFSDIIDKLDGNNFDEIPGLATALDSTYEKSLAGSLNLLAQYWQLYRESQSSVANREQSANVWY
jgi:hypothetical protein